MSLRAGSFHLHFNDPLGSRTVSKRNLRVVAVVLGVILLCAVLALLIGPFLLPIDTA